MTRPLSLMAAATLAAAAVAATPTASAAVPAGTVAPADVATPAVVKHVNTDMDGDGTRDSVDLTYLGSDQFELAVTTTKGKTSKVSFTSHVDADMVPAAMTWYGADAIDGRKGSELIVHLYAPGVTDSGQNLDVAVYTWRSGKLVAEPAPQARTGTGWQVGVGEGSEQGAGYWFFASHGRRYVDTTRLSMSGGTPRYTGSVTRSVWRKDHWVELWSRSLKAKTLTWKQTGMAGPKLLRGQVKVDISGDGRTDLALFYQLGLEKYRVTVLAHGRSASADVTHWKFPFIGAAAVDGVAGDELIAMTGSKGDWTVFTWRHSGKLTKLRAPALYGEAGNSPTWHRAKGAGWTNVTLSVESGRHYVVTAWSLPTNTADPVTVRFARSVWDGNHWTKLSEWTDQLTLDQLMLLGDGFTAPDLVTP